MITISCKCGSNILPLNLNVPLVGEYCSHGINYEPCTTGNQDKLLSFVHQLDIRLALYSCHPTSLALKLFGVNSYCTYFKFTVA